MPANTFIPTSKKYELSNHLGNVLAVVSDRKLPTDANANANGVHNYYRADVTSATDYYAFGGILPRRNFNSTDYRYGYNKGSEKDDEIAGSGNTYATFYRQLDVRVPRWWTTDPKTAQTPWESPYVSMGGNPIWKNDPNGDIAIVDDAVIGFFRGLFAKRSNFESGAGTRIGNAFRRGGRQAANSAKIYGGLFTADKDKSFGGKVLEIGSRLTWQLPQTLLGVGYNQLANTFGNVSGVEYFHGATAVKGAGVGGGAVTLGSFISLSRTTPRFAGDWKYDPEANVGVGAGSYTFMHEYGHYLQSQRNGFSYLFKFGLPSILGAHWTEHDANQRAANYFHGLNPSFTWNSNYYSPGTWQHTYSKLPAGGTKHNTKWWEYFVLPAVPILNLKNPK